LTYTLDYLDIDSEVLELSAWNLSGIESGSDFSDALTSVDKSSTTNYITCKLPIEEVRLIHAAEDAGFHFVETQFKTILRLNKLFDTSRYPYDYVCIKSDDELSEVLKIAENTIEHDRFTRDPKIGSKASGLRYRRYLKDSFDRDDDEIWGVKSKSTGQLLTFRSHRKVSDDEVNLLIGGVHPDFKDVGLGIISSHFCFNQLHNAGYRRAITHISAANTPIVNLEVGHLGFRISQTFVVLRAIA
jgi:hypothetical protein